MTSTAPAASFAAIETASHAPYTYRGHLVTPIAGTTSCGQPKAAITGPVVTQRKACANVRICIDGAVNLAEREAIRAGLQPVISEESRRTALAEWGKRYSAHSADESMHNAYRAAFRPVVAA